MEKINVSDNRFSTDITVPCYDTDASFRLKPAAFMDRAQEMAYLADARKREETKVSLRATARYDVADIAARFGGGGHAMAAGCRIPMPLAAACAALEAEMRRRMEEA